MNLAFGSFLILLIVSATTVSAQAPESVNESNHGIGAAFTYSSDSDNLYVRSLSLEYFPKYTSASVQAGMRYTAHQYKQDAWSGHGKQVSFLYRHKDPLTTNGLQLAAGISSQSGHNLLTMDSNYRTELTKRATLEMFVSRDWVETPDALDSGVNYTFAGASLDYILTRKLTLVGMLGIQRFSDHNSRNHDRFKVIYQPNLDLGLTLQLRYRAYTRSGSNLGSTYFDPNSYSENMLAVGWRKKVNRWMASITAGAGQQKIESGPYSPTHLLELDLQSPPNNKNYSFNILAVISQSASAYSGPGYRYNYLQGEWTMAF
jgi:hypothetical protein